LEAGGSKLQLLKGVFFLRHVTTVFWIAIGVCLVIVLWGGFSPGNLEDLSNTITAFIYVHFGWYYMLVIVSIIIFAIYMTYSRFGKITLGKKGDKPEFSLLSWFAMLFSAGMGIGLVFFTTAEPISHAFISAPGGEVGTDKAIRESLQFAMFHWGLHGWALYSIVALILAYFKFNKGAPGLISATLVPVFGEKSIRGTFGKVVDILAIIATVVGVASTLGFGSAQIRSGLAFLFGTPETFTFQMIILAVATVLFIASAWSGLGNGIKHLSTINILLGLLLVFLLFIVGPTMYILNMFTSTIGNYLSNIVNMSFQLRPQSGSGRDWINDWTIFYWAWWISWAPFVGMFIARVSKGRTVKQFIIGVILAPTLVTLIFFSVFGVSALNLEQHGIAKISEFSIETSTFGVLQHYPMGSILAFITIFVIAIFFITSADSATFVLGMFSTGGQLNPANMVKIAWGVALSAMAAIVSYSGGVQGFQNLLIITALPFSLIIILMIVSFFKDINREF
jgi:glycine betaine transporter